MEENEIEDVMPVLRQPERTDDKGWDFFKRCMQTEVDPDMLDRVEANRGKTGGCFTRHDARVPPVRTIKVGGVEVSYRAGYQHPVDCDCSYCKPMGPFEGDMPEEDWWGNPLDATETLRRLDGAWVRRDDDDNVTFAVPTGELYTKEERDSLYARLQELMPGERLLKGDPNVDTASMQDIFFSWMDWLDKEAEAERAAREAKGKDKPVKKLLAVYVNVGALPPEKTQTCMDRFKQDHQEAFDRLPPDVEPVFFPVRGEQETRMELLSFS